VSGIWVSVVKRRRTCHATTVWYPGVCCFKPMTHSQWSNGVLAQLNLPRTDRWLVPFYKKGAFLGMVAGADGTHAQLRVSGCCSVSRHLAQIRPTDEVLRQNSKCREFWKGKFGVRVPIWRNAVQHVVWPFHSDGLFGS
jgi:hypothetical protein